MTDIQPGTAIRLAVAFTNASGSAADPTTVKLKIRPKGGTERTFVHGTDAELVKDSTGSYHLDYTVPNIAPDRGMNFYYTWIGTGTVAVVKSGTFNVSDSYGRA